MTSVVFIMMTGRSVGKGVCLSLRYEVEAIFSKTVMLVSNVHSGWDGSVFYDGVETLGAKVTPLFSGTAMENSRIQSQMETH